MKILTILLALNLSALASTATGDFACTTSQEQVDSLLARIKTLEETINHIKQTPASSKKTYQCVANMEFAGAFTGSDVYDSYRAESEDISDAEDTARSRCNKGLTPNLKSQGARCKIEKCFVVETTSSQSQEQLLTRIKQVEENHEILKILLTQITQAKQPHYTCDAQITVGGRAWTVTGEGSNPSEAQKNAYNFCYDRLNREGLSRFCELLPCKKVTE